MSGPALLQDDLRVKISPLRLSLQNAANDIADPVYIFIDPTRAQAAALGRHVLQMTAAAPSESFSATPQSSLSIYFPRDLLSLNDVRAIQLQPASAEGWTLELPIEDEAPLILKPRRAFIISKDQPQTIAFSQVLATSGEPIKLRSITFAWENFTGLTDDLRICNATRELPPGATDERANLEAKWGPRTEYYDAADTVYVTPYTITTSTPGIANRLVLRIGNKEDGQLENNHAEFTVTFPTTKNGDARVALCTPEQLSKVQCIQVASPQSKWQIEPVTDSEVRHWILRPPANAQTVFGQDPYVSFEFSGLVTEMLVAPCAAVVSWSGIKGRKSGALRVAVEKTAPRPAVIAFNAHAGSRELRYGDAVDFKEPVTLDWRLFAADACRVDESEDGALRAQLTLKPGDTKVALPTKPGTIYTLTPLITLDGSPRRGTPVDKKFSINPATAKLRVDPDRLVPSATDTAETCPTKTTLRWECASGDCFLSGPGLARYEVPRTGQLEVTARHDAYKIESIGLGIATATAKVTLPLPFIKFKVESAPNSAFRLTWQSAYVKDFRIGGPSPALPESRSPSGAMNFQFNATSMEATGAGTFKMRVNYAGPGAFPNITAIVYFSAQGPVFRWAVTDATEVKVMCIGKADNRTFSGEIPMAGSIELTAVNTLSPRRKNFAGLTFVL